MKKEKELKPTVYGIGYNDMHRGWTEESELNNRIYNTWRHMLLRTTQKWWNKCPSYTETTVSDEWIYLSNFVRDVKELPNYNEWAKNEEVYFLDKDVLGNGQKHYSKKTCYAIFQNLVIYAPNSEVGILTKNKYWYPRLKNISILL